MHRLADDRSCAEKMEKSSKRTNIQQTAGQCQVDRKQRRRRTEHCNARQDNAFVNRLPDQPTVREAHIELVPRTPTRFSLFSGPNVDILPITGMMKRFRIYKKRSLILLQWSVLSDGVGQVLFLLRQSVRNSKQDFKAYLLLPDERASLSDV